MKPSEHKKFKLTKPQRTILTIAVLAVMIALPFLIKSAFILHALMMILIYVVLVLSVNLITGFSGMLTMGNAAFYGVGAYASALLMMRLGFPWILAFLGAGLIAAIFGVLLAIPCLRVGGDYMTLMTIGFNAIFTVVATNWTELTRGSMGIPSVPPPSIGPIVFDTLISKYFLYLAIAALCYFFMHRLINSYAGRALEAIREDEIAAAMSGINLSRYKVLAFTVGAMWSGFAGSMLAHSLTFVGPQSFSLDESIVQLEMAILGGLGSLPGSLIGAAIMVSLPQLFQAIYKYRMLVNGLILLILMALRPQGIMGVSMYSGGVGKKLVSVFKGALGSKEKKGEQA